MKTTQDISNECINSISREEALKRVDKDGYVHFERFGSIHIDNWKEKSDREKAIEWWNKLTFHQKQTSFLNQDFKFTPATICDELTGREIEQIWRKETQQSNIPDDIFEESEFQQELSAVKRGDLNFFLERPQVDFERLSKYINVMNQLYDTFDIQNLCLFFNLLSKSSTFAHKAHKELNKLMK